MRIGIIWERGGGYGHAPSVRTIGCALERTGHSVSYLIQAAPAPGYPWAGADVSPGPRLPHPRPSLAGTANHAEWLAQQGFLDVASLVVASQQYSDLFAAHRLDAVVLESAPVAALAAHASRLPAVTVGTGFGCPPPTHPMPALLPGYALPAERCAESERRVLDALNKALRDLEAPVVNSVGEFFGLFPQVLTTFPETDHFDPRDRGATPAYAGIDFSRLETTSRPEWPNGRRPKIAAYLKRESQDFGSALAGLATTATRGVLHVAPVGWIAANPPTLGRGVRAYDQPFDMVEAAHDADAVFCHGGHGTVVTALLCAAPVLILPTQPEQLLLGRRIERQGLGLVLAPGTGARGVRRAIERLTGDREYQRRAQVFSRKHRNAAKNSGAAVADRVCRALGRMQGH